jgi:hypothetical protein
MLDMTTPVLNESMRRVANGIKTGFKLQASGFKFQPTLKLETRNFFRSLLRRK